MRKSLYLLAAAVLLGSAVNASAYNYTVTPESGSTVESLTNVRIKSDDIEYFMMSWTLDPSGVTVTKDGVKVAGVQFRDDYDDYNAINLDLEPYITEAGAYVLTIPAGTLQWENDYGDSGVFNDEAIVLNYTVQPKGDATYDVEPSSVYPASGSEINITEYFQNVTLTFAGEYKMKPGATATFACAEAGYSETVQIKDFSALQAGTYIVPINEVANPPVKNGQYTVTIEKGMFGTASFIATGNSGYANDVLTYTYEITGAETSVNDDEVNIESVVYTPVSGDAVVLTNDMAVAAWADDSKLVFNTTNNLAVGYIYAQIIDRNPINPDEAIVRVLESHARRTLPEDRGTFWQDDEAPFLSLSRELVFEEGHVYDLKVVLYDFETPPYSRTELATYDLVINGSTPGYQYADAHLISITPEPDKFLINTLADAHFTMTFDNWVKVNVSKSGIPGAYGMTYLSESDIEYSDDHKAFTITIPESEVMSANGTIAISVYVTDEEGHAVFTGSDTKENSYFSVAYACYLGSPDLTISPASGVVEEIKDIYVSCPGGPTNGMINVLSAAMTGNIKITDLSGDVVFAEFTSEPVVTASSTNNDGEFPTQLKFSLDEAITAPGVYVVNIPPAYFALGAEYDSAVSKAQFVTYTIEGEPVDETVYDFIPYIDDTEFEKNDNDEIVKAKLTVWFEESMIPDYNKTSLLELRDADNNKLDATFMLDADWSDWQILYVTITYPFVEGEAYSLVMPAGIVGNDAWADGNYLTGRANPLCVLNVYVEEDLPPVEFDLDLTTSVELKEADGNIVQAIVTFDSGDYLAWDSDMLEEVELVDALGNTLDATVNPGMSLGGAVKLVVSYDFEPNQKYQLMIPEGLFGDETWEEEEFMTGHANAEMAVEIDTTVSGVENVIAGDVVKVDVYNLQGVMIVKDADAEAISNLPAGLYIIGGKKVAVK